MTKPKSGRGAAGTKHKSSVPSKRRTSPKTVDEYIAHVPEPGRGVVQELRAIIRSAVPRGATEVISYGIPAFRQKRVLVWYAAFSHHCSLFPTNAVIEIYKDELKRFATSKGTIKFPIDEPLPAALIKKMVKTRVTQAAAS
jgi:uncharacterized protein YdhG (YjbR/CyaY superfamily)